MVNREGEEIALLARPRSAAGAHRHTHMELVEAERLFSELKMAAGDDADRDLYFDEATGSWDLDGLRSDLAVYSPEPQAAAARFQSPPPPAVPSPLAANFAAAAVAPPPQYSSPPPAMAAAPAPPFYSPAAPAPPATHAAAAAPTPPPPVAAAPPFQSPEPTFEQMMSAATPLNAPAQNAHTNAQPSSPPFGSGAAPASRDSTTSWQTVGAGLCSPPAGGAEASAYGGTAEEPPSQGQAAGAGWLVGLVENGIAPTLVSNAPALVSNMAASAFSWVGGLRQQEAEPPREQNAYVYNSEIGVRPAAPCNPCSALQCPAVPCSALQRPAAPPSSVAGGSPP